MDTTPLNFETLSSAPLPPCDPVATEAGWSILPELRRATAGLGIPESSVTLSNPFSLMAKRIIDLTAALSVLTLLAPVLLGIALCIRLDSPGPVLFRQRRLGRFGRPFWIYKFRTMRADAEKRLAELEAHNEAAQGVLFKMTHDPRVTRLGHFLRRTNLDELPQFWNVLMGEMSLVGPRPFQMRDSERLQAMNPHAFTRRLEFLPGLTGAWQVGRAAPTDSEHLLELDLEYVENWSLARDLRIIYKTFFVLFAGFRNRW
ncbi:MAG: sugar transferase [Isosphaeraceae bacterium]